MKKEIVVPSLGESITEATIGEILVFTGTEVKIDQELLELETDKVNQLLYAPVAGVLFLSINKGEKVKIGQTIGFVETSSQKKEIVSNLIPKKVEVEEVHPLKNQESLRYTKESFLKEINTKNEKKSEEIELPASNSGKERETRRPLSKIRKVISQRLVEAQQNMAMLTTFNEVDMTAIMELRDKYKEFFLKKEGVKLGFMSFFVKAVVAALEEFPDLNSYLDGEEVVQRHYFDIGVAVGTDRGVIVPVIRDCNHLSYATIEKKLEEMAKKAREGQIKVNDLQGGGFTITNGGVYGSLLSTPIVIPPQCAILGMHKIEKRPVVIQDQIMIRSMMYVALSYDHRLIDGKEAVSFLVYIKSLLEEPARLLLEI